MSLKLLDGVTADGAGSTIDRNISQGFVGVVSAIFKYKKTNTGTCTLELKDGDTDAVIVSLSVVAANPDANLVEVAVPHTFYAEVSSKAGTIALDAYIDGL